MAYEIFAEAGPVQMNINQVGKLHRLTRTSFYYYFTDKDDLIEHLLQEHIQKNHLFIEDLKQANTTELQTMFEVVAKHQQVIKFQRQLLFHTHNAHYQQVFESCSKEFFQIFSVALFNEHEGLHPNCSQSSPLYRLLLTSWYTHLNVSNFEKQQMVELAMYLSKNLSQYLKAYTTTQEAEACLS